MRQCKNCGKKGLFLKIEEDTGLCLSCNEEFASRGKALTEQIMQAKSSVVRVEEAKEVAALCREIEQRGQELIELHEAYNLPPSQELLDLIEAYRKVRTSAED
jgi:hypothetical protein